MSEFADSVADGVGFMAELTESAGTLNLELNPVRAIFQGLALTAFVIQNAFRQLPDALIIFSSGFRRSLLQIQSDFNDVLSNLPQRFGGAVSAQTRDDADRRIRELRSIEEQARANLAANQSLAQSESEALLGRLTGLTAAEDNIARQEQALEAQLETRAIGRICLLYTSPSPRDGLLSRMPSSA